MIAALRPYLMLLSTSICSSSAAASRFFAKRLRYAKKPNSGMIASAVAGSGTPRQKISSYSILGKTKGAKDVVNRHSTSSIKLKLHGIYVLTPGSKTVHRTQIERVIASFHFIQTNAYLFRPIKSQVERKS